MILLDLKLPKIDGIEVLRRIKSDPRTQTIPGVVLTSSKEQKDVVESYRLGVNSYIVKLVDLRNFSEVTPRLSLAWALVKPASSPSRFCRRSSVSLIRLWKARVSCPTSDGRADLKALLGVAIRIERSVLGISQEELAERAGLHRTYISDVERGARNPSISSIEKLALALKLSVSALFARASNGNGSKELVEILLVEDNPRDVQLTKRAFEKARITNPMQVVGDGVEALDFLFATGSYAHRWADRHFKVILLDLNLPKISGLEVLRRIKADQRTRKIPVVVLTVSNRDRDFAECRRLGAETYIVKPVAFQNFSEVIPRLEMEWALLKRARKDLA